MKNISSKLALLVGGLFVLFAGVSPALGQEKDKEVKKEVIVKVDEDGNITINGEPAEEGEFEMPDGSRMIVDRDGGRVIVIEEDEGGRKVVRRRMRAPDWDDEEDFVIFETDDDDDVKVFRHRIRVPDAEKEIHVLMDKLGEVPHGVMSWRGAEGDREFRMRTPAPMFLDEDFDFDFEFANPDIMKMESDTRKLARQILKAEGAERQQLEQQLQTRLNEVFDKKLESRRKRIENLQKRLEKQQAELRERETARKEIIERRKDELLGDDKLEW